MTVQENGKFFGKAKISINEIVLEEVSIPCQKLIKINQIICAGLNAVNPCRVTQHSIQILQNKLIIKGKKIELTDSQRIILVGFGKAAQGMAMGVKLALGKYIKKGIVITKTNNPLLEKELSPEIITLIGNHPVPGKNSVESSNRMIEFLKESRNDDLIICVISGGGSALFTQPANGISLKDMQLLSEKLIFCGADINEINIVRKQIDLIKGGGLVRMVCPQRMVSLIFSDVVGDSLSTIASGPTIPEDLSKKDAWEIIKKYNLEQIINPYTLSFIKNKSHKPLDNSEARDEQIFLNVSNIVIGNNSLALAEAMKEARRTGFIGEVISSQIHGDSRQIGRMFGERIINLKNKIKSTSKPLCLIAGGETTTIVKGKGKGGRNLETALACAVEIDGIKNVCFVAMATDGEDGSSDFAGAIITGQTIMKARNLGLDPAQFQERNNTYNFFARVGGLIKTGSTGTNVNDIYLLIVF